MKQKIQLMAKKITAIVCAIAMFVTGLYAVDWTGSDVQAAYTEISITSTKPMFLKDDTYFNIGVTNITDFTAEGSNFLTEEFASEWMTFGGGLTYEELVKGLRKAVVTTSSIIQFNWNHNTSPRTEGFIAGTSFTIKQGAPLPYNGASAYVQLDADYTFTFQEPTDAATQYNTVVITKQKTRTVSLGRTAEFGTGLASVNPTTNIYFDASNNETD